MTITDKIAPNWIAMVKVLVNSASAIPIKEEPIIICPVEETGKNSVNPSIIPKITASIIVIMIRIICLPFLFTQHDK